MEKIEFSVVGAGIIGIMTALELKRKFQGEVVLFEKESLFGEHSSGRNSGVIHSGIYYKTNSLKHFHCLKGKHLWKAISTEVDIPMKTVGKFIFSAAHQEAQLSALYQKGTSNGVESIGIASRDQIDLLNQYVDCSNAIWINDVAIIDQSEAMKSLLREFESLGGIYLAKHKVVDIKAIGDCFQLVFENGIEIVTEKLINCAGLFGVGLRRMLNLDNLENYFVKGNYLRCSAGSLVGISSLLYPMPEPQLKGLGVHLTLDMADGVRFGPNTEDVVEVEYSMNSSILSRMSDYVVKTYKGVRHEDLHVDYCGIRSKILKDGVLYEDFWIENPLPNYFETLGIESPGFTAAPSIASHIVALVEDGMKKQ